MTRNLTKTISTLAFCLSSLSVLSTAHAWKVNIDCHGPGGAPSWASTNDTIYINVAYDGGGGKSVWSAAVPASKCDAEKELKFTGTGDPSRIYYIEVYTFGNDTFWIDWLEIRTDSNAFVWSYGTSNDGSGWCISSTPADGSNAYCPSPASWYYAWYPGI
jgi:hypothetical protein